MINNALFRTLTVLYVEDDELMRDMLIRFLKRRVGTVYDARNGEEGLEAYISHKGEIDVIITDMTMPVVSGMEMIKRVFEVDIPPPIIITVACVDEQLIDDKICINVLKPIDEEKLLESIVQCIEKRYPL